LIIFGLNHKDYIKFRNELNLSGVKSLLVDKDSDVDDAHALFDDKNRGVIFLHD